MASIRYEEVTPNSYQGATRHKTKAAAEKALPKLRAQINAEHGEGEFQGRLLMTDDGRYVCYVYR